jgi:hypothetical protein
LKTDIESLLLSLRPDGHEQDVTPSSGWTERIQSNVQRWHFGRLLLFLGLGMAVTIVAWTALSAFSTVIEEYDAPGLAVFARYVLLALGLVVPAVLLVVTWLWSGQDKKGRSAKAGIPR